MDGDRESGVTDRLLPVVIPMTFCQYSAVLELSAVPGLPLLRVPGLLTKKLVCMLRAAIELRVLLKGDRTRESGLRIHVVFHVVEEVSRIAKSSPYAGKDVGLDELAP